MQKRNLLSYSMSIVLIIALFLAIGGCSEDSPTGLSNSTAGDVTLSSAKVGVDGQSLAGQDIQRGSHTGPMQFEARLAGRHGNPISGGQVQVRYGTSGMMGHMDQYMHMGEFNCFDDGTHGDPVPGDGIYCFADSTQEYGCHGADARLGEYRYEFCGFDQHGQQSNRMEIRVNLVP